MFRSAQTSHIEGHAHYNNILKAFPFLVMSMIKWGYSNDNDVMCSRGARGWEYGIGAK